MGADERLPVAAVGEDPQHPFHPAPRTQVVSATLIHVRQGQLDPRLQQFIAVRRRIRRVGEPRLGFREGPRVEMRETYHQEGFGLPILGGAVEKVRQGPAEPTRENLECGQTRCAVVPLDFGDVALGEVATRQLLLRQPLFKACGPDLLTQCHRPSPSSV